MKSIKQGILICLVLVFAAATAYPEDVKKGEAIFNDSSLGTNGKSCNSCHPDGKGIDASKNTYSILGTQQENIEGAVNFCIEMALSGKALEKDSEKMKDIVSYLQSDKVKKKRKNAAPGY